MIQLRARRGVPEGWRGAKDEDMMIFVPGGGASAGAAGFETRSAKDPPFDGVSTDSDAILELRNRRERAGLGGAQVGGVGWVKKKRGDESWDERQDRILPDVHARAARTEGPLR